MMNIDFSTFVSNDIVMLSGSFFSVFFYKGKDWIPAQVTAYHGDMCFHVHEYIIQNKIAIRNIQCPA